MRKSKYLGMRDGDWFCSHVGVDRVQPAYTQKKDENGRKVRSKRAGHRTYYYIFERLTSDEKAMKMIRLGYWQAKQVFNGERSVEYFAEKKARKRSQVFTQKVSYAFCD
jgi:hypothetical protein